MLGGSRYKGHRPPCLGRASSQTRCSMRESACMTEQPRPSAGAAFLRAMEANPIARAAWERARIRFQACAQVVSAGMAVIEAERVKALGEFADAIRDALRETDRELEAAGFDQPWTIEDW